MTGTELDSDLTPESLAVSAAKWGPADYSMWLRAGLDRWFHPSTTPGWRAVAFRPLILNPDRDPVAQLIDAIETVPGGRERLRDAVSESLAIWTGDSGHSGQVLDALLRLAQRLPAARHVPALRRLLFDGHLNDQPERELLALQVLETAMELVALTEGEMFLRELRRSAWQPSFAATWLEGMARANKIDWFEGLLELRGDLERLDPTGENLQPVLRRMANRSGRAGAVVERLRSLDEIDPWLERALFGGEYPAFRRTWERFVEIKNGPIPTIGIGNEIFPLYSDPDIRERNENLYRIVFRGRSEPALEEPMRMESRGTKRRHGRVPEEILAMWPTTVGMQ
ncbi:MAG: hypothetical protein QOD11_1813 [Bradyrhizobium sp.]|jgi:hypothetical protein|nr:hypothetical protein [Bradyrhizobium sp.]